jgi:LDH2 family malate/lactate/ureidoglycolate dehydrogenase
VTDAARRIPADDLRRFATLVLEHAGLSDGAAGRTAGYLVAADLQGVHTHGTDLLPPYHEGLTNGSLDPAASPEVVHRHGAVSIVDGGNGLGYETSRVAMDAAIAAAREHGIGLASVRNSNHFGMAGHWTRQAVEAGMIGFATTNGPPVTGPWGGREVLFSNNPLSWGIPTLDPPPLIFDIACTEAARGKIRLAAQQGSSIPAGWALDANGKATTDPRAALDGLLLPVGGHKGSGLAIVNEILAGALSGSRTLTDVPAVTMSSQGFHPSWLIGHFFMALSLAAFGPREQILERIDGVIVRIRAAQPADGFEQVMVPGEPEAIRMQQRLAAGIPMSGASVGKLDELAARLGIDPLQGVAA